MIWGKLNKIFQVFIIFLNIFIIFYSNLLEPGSKAVLLASIIIIIITLPIIFFFWGGKGKTIAINASLLAFFLLLIEALFFLKIIQHKAITTWTIPTKKKVSVEFLDKQPFVKFKPNVVVRSQGYRGNDFTYEWKTDQFGFKNKNISEPTNFHFIALGDSFTEGMGVSIENTWVKKVSDKSVYKIYNAGVQGYSASQMKGTYENLKDKISHTGIIIGVLPGIYTRESIFSEYSASHESLLGIGGIRTVALGYKGNSFLVQFIRATKKFFFRRYSDVSSQINQRLERYVAEIPKDYKSPHKLLNDKNWIAYTKHLTQLADVVLKKNKRVILIQYPHRYEVYFSLKELGIKDKNKINYYVELDLLKKTLPKNVVILDIFPFLKEQLSISNQYIYFEKDGHMNENGHELVAKFILQYLQQWFNKIISYYYIYEYYLWIKSLLLRQKTM